MSTGSGDEQGSNLPPMDFANMVISIGTSAMVSMGQIPDPASGQHYKDLDSAKQTIDMLGVIAEKTKGNLTSAEEQLLTKLLFDLRMGFVNASS